MYVLISATPEPLSVPLRGTAITYRCGFRATASTDTISGSSSHLSGTVNGGSVSPYDYGESQHWIVAQFVSPERSAHCDISIRPDEDYNVTCSSCHCSSYPSQDGDA
jgi:hypothetical protein